MLAGDRAALSRLLSQLERDTANTPSLMKAVHPRTGHAYTVGVTGPPGAGKSTLIDGLIPLFRREGLTVGVLAVDPTSPFTGGAVLGDRVRMQRHSLDDGVFIRSIATRGAHGGLSLVARAAIRLLDAFGRDIILVETVGVGQTELDVVKTADSVVVTLVPEAGDAVQVLKAGLMEIADIFVVNKADREGADRVETAVKAEVRATRRRSWWTPPVLLTQAESGEGVQELYQAIDKHRLTAAEGSHLERRRRDRRRIEFTEALRVSIEERIAALDLQSGPMSDVGASVEQGTVDPYTAAADALGDAGLLARLAGGFEPSQGRVIQRPQIPRMAEGTTFLGIDLTSSEAKPTACALLDSNGDLQYVGFQRSNEDILSLVDELKPAIVAIDAPLGLPKGMDCLEEGHACESEWPFKGRLGDRKIIDRGISIYVITKRTFIKPMVYRAIELARDLRERGHRVIEVYPYASKVCLFGKPIPRKSTTAGRRFLHESLRLLVGGMDGHDGSLDHDQYDAIVAAYTGYLNAAGMTEALGLEEEGQIVIPKGLALRDK